MPKPPPADWTAARVEIERLLFELPGFRSCSIRRRAPDAEGNLRAVFRPVVLQGSEALQLTLSDAQRSRAANLSPGKARAALRELLAEAEEVHVATSSLDLHARFTRKGRLLLSRSRPLQREDEPPSGHDRAKQHPLDRIDARLLLRALGFSDAQDRLRPSMQAKYRQVNEFLRILDAVIPDAPPPDGRPLRILDAGCGKAYLTLCAQVYLAQTRSLAVEWTGVDLREDVIRMGRAMAGRLLLEPPAVSFAVADIATYAPSVPPDIVVSLHACDTATDEAIARGVEWGARVLLCAPCCQHQVQAQLQPAGPQRALLRHGILRERLADLLADAFRAQLLRLLGYRVRVVEFVEPEATGRNILIRAERGVRPGMPEVAREYRELRDAWGVVPPPGEAPGAPGRDGDPAMNPCLAIGAVMMLLAPLSPTPRAENGPASPVFRIVAFGDSTTAPRGTLSVYADLLQRELPGRGIPAEVINAGVGGHTTANARARFQSDVLDRRPDLVILQFGINDAAVDVWREPPATQSRVPLEAYLANLGFFIDAIRNQGGRVILMTPNALRWTPSLKTMYGKPPYRSEDEDGFGVPMLPYVEQLRRLATERAVPLVDVHAAFEAYGRQPEQAVADLLLDGMHPNAQGHRLVADLLLAAIRRETP